MPEGRGLAEDERERSQPPALRATSFQRKEGEAVKTIYSLPVEGGCPKGRGLAEGKVHLSTKIGHETKKIRHKN